MGMAFSAQREDAVSRGVHRKSRGEQGAKDTNEAKNVEYRPVAGRVVRDEDTESPSSGIEGL